MRIVLPNDWRPRSYQLPLWKALESGQKRSVCIWHRRSGKDLTVLNYAAVASQKRVGTYWHVAPTYKQGRKIVWEGIRGDGRRFLDAFPGWRNPTPDGFVTRVRDDEMTIWLQNGSVFQVIGSEDVDRLVGPNPVWVAMTEYAIQDPKFWEYVRPILLENDGIAVFIYTPRGRSHGYKLWQMAKDNDRWFTEMLTVEDTERICREALEPVPVTSEMIEREREEGYPEALIQQEYYTSFDAPLEGSYYGDLIERIRREKQVGRVPHEPGIEVHTAWDLGRSDATAIVFYQRIGAEIRIIDYEEGTGKGMDHYIKIVKEKPYVYGDHWAPHDIKVHDYSSVGGRARYEIARDLGIHFRILRKLSLADGIQAARALIPRCWFHEEKTERLLQALTEYTKTKMPDGTFSDMPHKDWTNHPADAFRYLAVGLRPERARVTVRLSPELAIV